MFSRLLPVKKALEVTKELGGENYVFWGGREGYETLLNTNLKREQGHLAAQDGFSVLGDPHHMAFQVVHGMRAFSVTHARIVLPFRLFRLFSVGPFHVLKTAYLKGRGFDPIYRQ